MGIGDAFKILLGVALFASMLGGVSAQTVPPGFEVALLAGGLEDPDGLAIAPDGRLFVAERIQGRLRVVTPDGTLLPAPFLTVDGPQDGGGVPVRHRSAGLRGIAFDPDFATNRYVYVFYMQASPRHNRVSRFRADATNPNVAEAGSEEVLLELPFNSSANGSSGSHNGGALLFGADGMLYITTGDGWGNNGIYPAGDPVQSLATFTGKMLRIAPDGSIPSDNPFFATATGDYRAIYALGLRNPYTTSRHPTTGQIYINDVVGANKGSISELVAGGNYQWQNPLISDNPVTIGSMETEWANAGTLITGGAWYFDDEFPAEYFGSYFVAGWQDKVVRSVVSNSDPTVGDFLTESNLGSTGPIYSAVGPNGSLYYLTTDYVTPAGAIYEVRAAATNQVATPRFTPDGGTFFDSVEVVVATATSGAAIHVTTDGSEPTEASPLYAAPLILTETTLLRARAFRADLDPSEIAEAQFTRGTLDTSDGLVAFWRFEGTGATVIDSSPAGNDAALDTASRTADGRVGAGVAFDGDGDRIDAGTFGVPGGGLTLAAWINGSQFDHFPSNDARILSKTTGTAEDDHIWMLSTIEAGAATRLRFRARTGDNTTTLIAGSGDLAIDTWYFVAATYDGSAMRLYLDGVEVGMAAKSGAMPDSAVAIAVGNNPAAATGGDKSWAGRIDEVRIYDRALSPEEIEYIESVESAAPATDALRLR